MDLWVYHHKVEIAFSWSGKPTDGFVESFGSSVGPAGPTDEPTGSRRLTLLFALKPVRFAGSDAWYARWIAFRRQAQLC
ncbi:protein of unknown function [Burkholderia multivorans]